MNYWSRVGIEFETVGFKQLNNEHGLDFNYVIRIVFSNIEAVTGIKKKQIVSKVRDRKIRQSRQIVHYFLKKYTTLTLKEIGVTTLNDHATVLHSLRTVESDVCIDKNLMKTISIINNKIKEKIK